MAKKTAVSKKLKQNFATVVMVFTKSSQHWFGLSEPEMCEIEGVKFIAGKQITGKPGHRMEGKRTLLPFEHVASIIEFASEEDFFSEPQPRNLPAPDGEKQAAILTSHEQPHPQHRGPHGRNQRRRGKRFGGGNRHQGDMNFNR